MGKKPSKGTENTLTVNYGQIYLQPLKCALTKHDRLRLNVKSIVRKIKQGFKAPVTNTSGLFTKWCHFSVR